ncbi:MAG TPA: sulfate ABC transporter substrate-binding protein [Pseudomonadales bacterium]|nr:sulfate ABC transporter substrate-binding protein [Pseudomonadales bacterium]
MRNPVHKITAILIAVAWFLAGGQTLAANVKILNVSSDLTKGFYQDYNAAFATYWKQKQGNAISIKQSSGDSTQQAQSIIDQVDADVVALDRADDIDVLYNKGRFLDANWAARLPDRSVPFTSTIVFVVRQGNPKDIRNWDDLVRPDVAIVATSPKTSDEGRYSYLAAWGFALKKSSGNEKQARDFVAKLYAHTPVVDAEEDGATSAFAAYGIGDVLLIVESQAALVQKQFPKEKFEVVLPPVSIRVENAVAWVDHMVERHHNEALARAYLEYLYSDEGQKLAAEHFFRPGNETILERYSTRYKPLETFTVDEVAGNWQKAQKVHFAEGGIFDQIYHPDDSQ